MMGVPTRLRACLAHMAASNVVTPLQTSNIVTTLQTRLACCSRTHSHVVNGGANVKCRRSRPLWQQPGNVWEQFAVYQSRAYSIGFSTKTQLKTRKALQAKRSVVKEITEESLDTTLVEAADSIKEGFQFSSINGDDEIAQELAAMTGTISNCTDLPVVSNSLCVGIDPDLSGAIAILKTEENTTVAQVIDVPCVTVAISKRMRRRHDYQSMAELVRQLQAPQGSIAYVEQAMPFPKDGKQGWYTTGYGYGVWLGILAAAGFTVVPVQARVWKTAMGICGKEFSKDDSRALASSMFPVLSAQLRRKKDHGRAEALLIAAFGKGMTLTSISSLEEQPGMIQASIES